MEILPTMLRRLASIVLACGLAGACDHACGADLGVAAAPRIVLVTPQREQVVRLTASNAGPETVSSGSVVSLVPMNDGNLIFRIVPEPGCSATLSTVSGGVAFSWSLPVLVPGSSRSCAVGVIARPTASTGSAILSFGISAPGNTDPNSFNNFTQAEVVHTAVDRPNDLSLSVTRLPGGILTPGTSQTLLLTFSNVGVGTHDSISALSNSYDVASGPGFDFAGYDLLASASTPPCTYFRDEEGASVFFVQIAFASPIPPGGQQSCTITIQGLLGATGTSTLTWELFPVGEGVYDVNAANNVVELQIPFQQQIVVAPVPATGRGLPGLMVLLLAAAYWRLRPYS